jgi:hypothetical protein
MARNPRPPPFGLENELVGWRPSTASTKPPLLDEALTGGLPCIFIDAVTEKVVLTSSHLDLFLRQHLCLSRLDAAYDYLWWAGRQFPARPLHRQVYELSRTIALTHRADLHLVWCPKTSRLFLNPLPKFLLSHFFWASHVSIDADLDACARGFLLSYIWLIRNEHDLTLAHGAGLLPAEIAWPAWCGFAECLIKSGGLSVNGLAGVHRRFHYGELRLNRLDHIYRVLCPLRGQQSIRGYGGLLPPSYSDFFRERFRWIIIVFAFSTTVLSALQVGLATDTLGSSKVLQDTSLAVVVMCFVGLAVIVAVVSALYAGLFVFFLVTSLSNTAVRTQKRRIWAEEKTNNDLRG